MFTVLTVLAIDFQDPDTQTCRVLHVFGYSDHLWRLMIRRFDLPLDVGPEDRTDDMTGRELQALAIKAIKLQENWAKSEPSVKTLTKAIHRDNDKFVESMDLLPGGQWLVTYQRGRTSSRVALWSLHDLARIHRSASLDFPRGKYFFAVGLQQNGDATLAITTGTKKHRYSRSICQSDTILISIEGAQNVSTPLARVHE